MSAPPPAPPFRLRWKTPLRTLILVTFALALVARVLPPLRARLMAPTGSAQWIWESRDRRDLAPAVFYAVRDFELDAVPSRARLLVTGDEEYILFLNGQRVGAGAWRAGEQLDSYAVGPLLQTGANRLLAELRSGRGAGGFLLSLEDGDGRQLARTDGEWRLFHTHHPGLVRGWIPLAGAGRLESEPPALWGYPPVGSWRSPQPGPLRPLFQETVSGQPIPAVTAGEMPRRKEPRKQNREPEKPERKNPPRRLFDWGREMTGYLALDVPASIEKMQGGLVYTSSAAPPDPQRDPPMAVLVMPGKRGWMSALPRRFRYALFVGIERPQAARVQPVDPKTFRPPVPLDGLGVFGIDPPQLRSPMENEIWGELESVPGVAGRKEG